MVFDEKLNSSANLRSLKSKLSKSYFELSKLRYFFDVSTLKMVYYSLFYPHIKYCISAWGSATECYLKQTVSLENKNSKVCLLCACFDPNKLTVLED